MSIWQAIWNSTPGGGGGGGGAVDSVNSQTGVVVLDSDDISEGAINKYYTATQARSDLIASSISDGDTTHSPDGNSVFDALALKQDLDTQLTSLAGLSYASNALKVIRVNAGETGFELAFGAGDVTSASNVGTAGVGLFKQKTGTDLEFKKINAGSNKVTITDDTGNDEVDIDIDQSNIDHGSIAGLGDDDHTQYHNDSRALTWLGTRSTTDLAQGTNLYFTDAAARAAAVSDVAYNEATWNGVVDVAPSKNALRDKFEDLGSLYATKALDNLNTSTNINAANLFFDTANTPRNIGGVPVTANAGPAISIVGYGTTPASGFNGGPIAIYTDTADANTGNISIYTSNAATGKAGDISLTAGTSGLNIMSMQEDYGRIALLVSNLSTDNSKSGGIFIGEGILNRYTNNDPSLITATTPVTYFYNQFSNNITATGDYNGVYSVSFSNFMNFSGTGPVTNSGTTGTHTAFQNNISFNTQHSLQYVTLNSGGVNVSNNSSIEFLNGSNTYVTVDSGSNCTNATGSSFNMTVASGATSYSGTVPVNKGGTGATTATLGFAALSPTTTAGDLIFAGFLNIPSRRAIGTENQVLTASGGYPLWNNPPIATSAVNFIELPGTAPLSVQENGSLVYKFVSAGTDELYTSIKIPRNYISGSQIFMYVAAYSPSSSNTILLLGQSTLIRSGTDSFASTTNQRTTTNAALTNTVASQLREFVLDITSSTGQINSVNVSAGDIIKVRIYRSTDTDTADIRVIPEGSDVKFY